MNIEIATAPEPGALLGVGTVCGPALLEVRVRGTAERLNGPPCAIVIDENGYARHIPLTYRSTLVRVRPEAMWSVVGYREPGDGFDGPWVVSVLEHADRELQPTVQTIYMANAVGEEITLPIPNHAHDLTLIAVNTVNVRLVEATRTSQKIRPLVSPTQAHGGFARGAYAVGIANFGTVPSATIMRIESLE